MFFYNMGIYMVFIIEF